ncbi:MAG: 5'-deoxynucleotidase [Oscillospiraceae bacterium]
MNNKFFAFASRIKYLNRWVLMRNTTYETLSSHSYEVATLSHALAVIGNKRLSKNYNAERAALIGLYHDTPEVITGDMPTPVKYYNKELRSAFESVENFACNKLVSMLPEDMQSEFEPLFFKEEKDAPLWKLVKAADKISAYIKCIEERKAGNCEFSDAEKAIKKAIELLELEEAKIFMEEFLPAYELPLDKLK